MTFGLNLTQRKALEALLVRRSAHAGHVRRARIVLLSAEGISGREIAERVGISEQHVSRIRARFVAGGRPRARRTAESWAQRPCCFCGYDRAHHPDDVVSAAGRKNPLDDAPAR